MSLQWRELDPFGVEIDHDLAQPLSAAEEHEFRDLFNEHGLLIARGQSLGMEQQQALCGLLGPILLRAGENGYMTNEGGGAAASEFNWHSDAAYTPHPFDALSLHALDVVAGASSTWFASAETVFDAMPDGLRGALSAATQEMIAPHYTLLGAWTCDQRDPPAHKRGIMPATYTNPHNGRRCVWVNAMQTTRLLDMEWEDSRALLHEVYDRIYAPTNVYEHRWHNGDIVIWDNIAVQHKRGNLEGVGKRLLQRAIVGSEGVAPHVN